MFSTLQGRLPKELRLAGIKTVEAANAWLKAHYIAESFAIKAEQPGTAFVADRHEAWREALCVIEERSVGNDNTIAWGGRRLQLPESSLRPHFVKAVVRVHEYPNGTVSVFLGPHRLATFADGQQISPDAPVGRASARPALGTSYPIAKLIDLFVRELDLPRLALR